MIRKLVATVALMLGLLALVAPASPAVAGGGPSDYAACVITVDPSTFGPGATVTVSGSGFQPNFETTIDFDGVTVGTALTDATGAFVATITIPDDATPGPHTISAICDAEGNISSTDVAISSGVVTQPTAPGGGPIPRTGSDVEPLVLAGVAAVLVGTTIVLIAKRRRRTSAAS